MKNPDRVSRTMLCAPNPSATPATPALASSGARFTFRLLSTSRNASVQIATTALVDSALVRVEARRRSIVCVSRSEEHTSELQSRQYLVCRLLLEKKHSSPTHRTPRRD